MQTIDFTSGCGKYSTEDRVEAGVRKTEKSFVMYIMYTAIF